MFPQRPFQHSTTSWLRAFLVQSRRRYADEAAKASQKTEKVTQDATASTTTSADIVTVYERSPLKFKILSGVLLLNSLLLVNVGGMVLGSLQEDPEKFKHKNTTQVKLFAYFGGIIVPMISLVAWYGYARGCATRLLLDKAADKISVRTVPFFPWQKMPEHTYATYRLYKPEIYKKHPSTAAPTLVVRENQGDPNKLRNLRSFMFLPKTEFIKEPSVFKELIDCTYKRPITAFAGQVGEGAAAKLSK